MTRQFCIWREFQNLEKAINNVLIKTANAIYTSKLLEKELSGLYKNIEIFEKSIGKIVADPCVWSYEFETSVCF